MRNVAYFGSLPRTSLVHARRAMSSFCASALRLGALKIVALLVFGGSGVGCGLPPGTAAVTGLVVDEFARPKGMLHEGLEFHLRGDYARAIDVYTRHLQVEIPFGHKSPLLPITGRKGGFSSHKNLLLRLFEACMVTNAEKMWSRL